MSPALCRHCGDPRPATRCRRCGEVYSGITAEDLAAFRQHVAKSAERKAVLRELEGFIGQPGHVNRCPFCHGLASLMDPHKPDCRLAAALKDAP